MIINDRAAIYQVLNGDKKVSLTSGDIIFCSEYEMYLIYLEGGKLKKLVPIAPPIKETVEEIKPKEKEMEKELYIIVEEYGKIKLAKLVNSKIKEGYVPLGGFVVEKRDTSIIYSQTLVLSSVLGNNVPNVRF